MSFSARRIVAALLLAFVGSNVQSEPASATHLPAPSVQDLIGGAACTVDDDCRTIAVGHKACGGPSAYLPWSIRETDGTALAAAVDQAVREAAPVKGRSSICSRMVDPGARCVPAATQALDAARSSGAPAGLPGRCELRAHGAAGVDLR